MDKGGTTGPVMREMATEGGKNMAETSSEQKCRFCDATLWDGAAFCTVCGNVAGGEVEESKWGAAVVPSRPSQNAPWMQKLVLLVVGLVAVYGVYVYWGGRIAMPVVAADSDRDAMSDVSAAENRLRELQNAIAAEDAKKREAEENARKEFKRQLEEVRNLNGEFSAGEEKTHE